MFHAARYNPVFNGEAHDATKPRPISSALKGVRMIGKISVAFLVVFLMVAVAAAQDVSQMDQVVQSFASKQAFMGSVLVAQGNEVLLSKGYGFANLEWNLPNSPTTKFAIASVTKQFTAAAILLLEERGKLKTDDLFRKWMPEAPAAWDKITIFQLLTHTSGVPNYTALPGYHSDEPFPATLEKVLARYPNRPLEFQPGEKFSYNSWGYVLLGYLLEKVTGDSYEKFIQTNIFTPLGMKDSGYYSNAPIIPRRSARYIQGKDGPEHLDFDESKAFSAGALYSTTEDLLRWVQGLFGGKLLSPTALAKMTSPTSVYSGYAMGVELWSFDYGQKYDSIMHSGGVAPGMPGAAALLKYFPEKKLTVVVLANLDTSQDGSTAVALISGRLAALALGFKPPDR
jgi:CubicO group peptidase (beta-lactamase class C family)